MSVVTSVLQTVAGRMIFARPKNAKARRNEMGCGHRRGRTRPAFRAAEAVYRTGRSADGWMVDSNVCRNAGNC